MAANRVRRATSQTERASRGQRGTHRRGFTVKELIVVVVCLVLVAGLLLPAIQTTRDGPSRRADCQSRMRQVAMAVSSYASQNGDQIPVGVYKGSRYTGQTWILPFLEATNIYKLFGQFDTTADKSAAATKNRLPIYICPSDNPSGTYTRPGGGTYARSNFVFSFGSDTMEPANPKSAGVFLVNRPSGYDVMSKDGTSSTAMVSETVSGKTPSDPSGAWGYGEAGSCGYTHKNLPTNTPVPPIVSTSATNFTTAEATASSNHPGGVNVVFADNHVQMIPTTIDLKLWQAIGTADGGETVPDPLLAP
ncbi:MAG: DUF1559 domain-containing protein [Planctomycetia bacterium]|nr:DUF1559 domain-containing protein [Planctomycetia bacterium]